MPVMDGTPILWWCEKNKACLLVYFRIRAQFDVLGISSHHEAKQERVSEHKSYLLKLRAVVPPHFLMNWKRHEYKKNGNHNTTWSRYVKSQYVMKNASNDWNSQLVIVLKVFRSILFFSAESDQLWFFAVSFDIFVNIIFLLKFFISLLGFFRRYFCVHIL